MKYKSLSGRLHEHFGFKLLVDGNIKTADNVCCIHCDKSFAYHGSNTSLTYHLQDKHSLEYSKPHFAKSASFSQSTAAGVIYLQADYFDVVLECVHVVERHYSNNVAELYKQSVKDWDITKKIQVLVTDNARNLVSAVNQIGFVHILCLAHSLQLRVLHGFKATDTETLFVKCRKIIGDI
uniref:BED-type domain-containing protein n=1 Tax=Octopus bimaculoides TaxID=37653 RepID=A0A0L8H915_OCTBM